MRNIKLSLVTRYSIGFLLLLVTSGTFAQSSTECPDYNEPYECSISVPSGPYYAGSGYSYTFSTSSYCGAPIGTWSITAREWSHDSSQTQYGTATSFTTSFPSPGGYCVRLAIRYTQRDPQTGDPIGEHLRISYRLVNVQTPPPPPFCVDPDPNDCNIAISGPHTSTTWCTKNAGQYTLLATCNEANSWYWSTSDGQTGIGQNFSPSFSQAGRYCVTLEAECIDCNGSGGPGNWFGTSTLIIDVEAPITKPQISVSPSTMCQTTNVLLQVTNPNANLTYDWYKRTILYTEYVYIGTGPSIQNSASVSGDYIVVVPSSGVCGNVVSDVRGVSVHLNEQNPSEIERKYRRSKFRATPFGVPGHYWQFYAGENSNAPSRSTVNDIDVTSDGFVGINRYNPAGNCWSNERSIDFVLDYRPPLAELAEVKKIGYNEVYFVNEDKDFVFQHAEYYWVTGTEGQETNKKFSNGGKILSSGTYYLRGRDIVTQTWGTTRTINVQLRSDDELNYIFVTGYDGSFPAVATSQSKTYFDNNGRLLQSQTKSFSTGYIIAGQEFQDEFDRSVGSALSAPVSNVDFGYKGLFLKNRAGNKFSHSDFANPDPFDDSEFGTLGWYYSDNNTIEPLTPKTALPYSRTAFYNDGTGEAKMSSGVGEALQIGSGREVLSGTFPVHNELDDYLSYRAIAIPGISSPNSSLLHEAVQTITRDQNGRFVMSVVDKSGNTLMSARRGTASEHVLEVINEVNASNESNPMVYLYLFEDQPVNITGSGSMVIENIITDQPFTPSGNWPAGFYRVRILSGSRSISYTNRYSDISYNYYDDAGRLITSISPNGVQSMSSLATVYDNDFSQDYNQILSDGTISLGLENGMLKVSGASQWNNAYLNLATEVDHHYSVTFFINLANGGRVDAFSSANSQNLSQISVTANGSYGHTFKAVSTSTLVLFGNSMSGAPRDFYLDKILIMDLGAGVKFDQTTYEYNHQGWLLSMTEPDAGLTRYAYRKDGSIRFSQNAKQEQSGKYSYTNYDASGRPVESGEYTPGTGLLFADVRNNATVLEATGDSWMAGVPSVNRNDWVKTHYDLAFADMELLLPGRRQDFLMGAVSWTENANIRTWYSYDDLGRVQWMAQQPIRLSSHVFVTDYSYDFLGNVLSVANRTYATGTTDLVNQNQFYHYYTYDADKRLKEVHTSSNGEDRTLQASYSYYLHGPLKRIELATNLQGIDFVYNINGWLTSINDPSGDPGGDGDSGINSSFRKDVFGMVLDYYESSMQIFSNGGVSNAFDPLKFHQLPSVRNEEGSLAVASSPFIGQLQESIDHVKRQYLIDGGDE